MTISKASNVTCDSSPCKESTMTISGASNVACHSVPCEDSFIEFCQRYRLARKNAVTEEQKLEFILEFSSNTREIVAEVMDLDKLARHEDWDVRFEVASVGHLPELLVKDECDTIRCAVLRNTKDVKIITMIKDHDEDPLLREMAREKLEELC